MADTPLPNNASGTTSSAHSDNSASDSIPSAQNWAQRLQSMSAAAEPTFWGYLGCRFVSADEQANRVVIALDIEPHHLNALGIVHGGVLSSLIDNAMGVAIMLARPDEKVVTTNLNVHFVSSLRAGTLTVTAEIIHQSRRLVTATGYIRGEGEQLTAMGTGTFRVI